MSKHTNKHTWDMHTHSYKLPWWFMSAAVCDHFPKGRTLTSDPSSGRKQFSSPSERSHPYSRLSSSSFTSVCLIHRSSPPAHLYSLLSPDLFVTFPSPPLHLLREGAYQAESRYELWAGFVKSRQLIQLTCNFLLLVVWWCWVMNELNISISRACNDIWAE